ncbi:O-antigen ligase family protein [Marinobacter sp. VGCF2001]|uniref:O-antigen ligase family protein n=1 Tax=Marinobacter sp. VGCF2001 TaxID=3417189 RepID=UPI003CE80E1D
MRLHQINLFLAPALAFSVVLFSNFVPSVFGSYADQRLLLSFFIVSIVTYGLVRLKNKQRLLLASVDLWPFIPLAIVFFIPLLHIDLSDFFLLEPFLYSLYVLAFGVSGFLTRIEGYSKDAATAVTITAITGCFFYAAITVMIYFFALVDNFSRLNEMIPWGFVNMRYWSHVATWLLPIFPLCLLIFPWKKNCLWRVAVFFTAGIWWWILLLSSSRGSIIGLLIGLVFVLALFGKSAVPWVKVSLKFLAIGVLIWFVLSLAIPSLVFDDIHVRGLKSDSSGRVVLWNEALAMSLHNFPLGMGPQSWLTHEILTDGYQESKKLGHPHNMYLMWAAEYGWISVLLFALLSLVAFRRLRLQILRVRVSQDANSQYLVAFTASVIAAFVHAGVSAVFIAPGSMLVGLCVLSVFWSLIKPGFSMGWPKNTVKESKICNGAGYVLIGFIAFLNLVWLFDVFKYHKAMVDDISFYQEEVSLGQLPRFWAHGYFPRHESQMPE